MKIDKEKIEHAVKEILKAIGENPERAGLLETPKRVAEMYNEVFSGNFKDPENDLKFFQEENLNKELILLKNIPVYSVCEHHMLPFFGEVKIGYLPKDKKIIGLSKIARIVKVFSQRLQVQERLTSEIADFLFLKLKPEFLIVILQAEHLCMTMRGVKSQGSKTKTVITRGNQENIDKINLEILKDFIKEK